MTTSPPPWKRPPIRLTRRGSRVVSVAVLALAGLLVLTILGMLVRGCSSKEERDLAVAPGESATPAVTPSASSSATPSSSPTPSAQTPSPMPSAGTGDDDANTDTTGMKHSGLKGKGSWKVANLSVAPAKKTVAVHRYVVKSEDGTGIDATTAARQISDTLNDPRGWIGHQGHSFELVKDPARAEFTIFLASPGTAQTMCPLDIKMTWSCRAGQNVILNTDRWLYMTPSFTDLTDYRAYMVNHEVGHFIGKDHVGCPAKGRKAPVMMQQSKKTDGCTPNPWPSQDGK
ncbi:MULTISPECIES: DUF3152 domain-containing protein [unclassified Luteococcus]|uniref:DUF3152 domain-containing protein n=1 Tax=unclassified Luteococcus TaxID=2639923 RepID=UPI00313B4F8E